ncbi:hypothetical protein [Plasticicumulans sp.]|uniref:hypothetical protein n=1 Tax=Plasticicumulans sp. TaxID=2307179 RepID=UPI002C98A75D|nr:hypothetical protein [Plasticicumulans sp.]MBS0601367.1 hypothetical protein [Pseudomonadota bacterium]HMV40180.1 hypothetical protein [Plasticicumulans sp.]HMW31221.1 hypothetical protein [Plasticicumulans sp.]HMW41866.1 hypothetical protein [Plasticicumulans sp.]HMX54415.1 hypothetical protein [Plasticicumulans sp.]
MVTIQETPFAGLEADGRLLSPVHKGPTKKPGRFGFRGVIALEFAEKMSDEARPPSIKADQVMAVGDAGASSLPFVAAMTLSAKHLPLLVEVLGERLVPEGKYFLFATDVDFSERWQLSYNGIPFWVLPLDEATVYNEVLELVGVEKSDLKKLDTAGKLDAVADAAAGFSDSFPAISYEDLVARLGSVRVNEYRPV